MGLLGSLLIMVIIFAVVMYLLQIIPIPAPLAWAKQAIIVILAAVFLIYLIEILIGAAPYHPLIVR